MTTNNSTVFDVVPGKLELTIFREFEAPRELVFKAFINPKLYVQWMGPRGFTTKLERFEPKSGGRWRYVSLGKDKREYAFHGVYHEILEPERIISTFEYEGLPEKGHVSLSDQRFESLPGERTRLIEHSVYLSVEDRDGMIAADMKKGLNESFERLDELLTKEGKKFKVKVGV